VTGSSQSNTRQRSVAELSGVDSRRIGALLRRWAREWGLTELPADIRIAYNPRLRRSLAKCSPRTGTISLNPLLTTAPPAKLAEVLCHEVAHVAAFRLYGRTVRPHGPEWAHLVRSAGYEPHLRAPPLDENARRRRSPRVYEHVCPICQQAWRARRSVRQWRCGDCLNAGLSGELVISKRG
jgi:SprT protein